TDADGFSDSQELDEGTIPWESTDVPTSAQKANSDHGFDFSNAVGLRVLGGPGDETSGEWEEHTNEFWTHQKKAIINPGLHGNGNPYIMNIFMELEVQIPKMLCPEDYFYIQVITDEGLRTRQSYNAVVSDLPRDDPESTPWWEIEPASPGTGTGVSGSLI